MTADPTAPATGDPTPDPKTDPKTDPAPDPKPDPKAGGDRLPDDHPAAQALAKANKEAEALRLKIKEFEDRDKSDAEKLADRATAAERDAADAKSELLKLKVAAAKGIPTSLADRLKGSTKEELEADADGLLATLGDGKGGKKPPNFDGGPKDNGATPAGSFLAQALRRTE